MTRTPLLAVASDRIAMLMKKDHRSVRDPSRWRWDEFGANHGTQKENLCDYEGAKIAVQAGYSPNAGRTLLETFNALAMVRSPKAPTPRSLKVRIDQIRNEIREFHWEALTKTRPLRLPYFEP